MAMFTLEVDQFNITALDHEIEDGVYFEIHVDGEMDFLAFNEALRAACERLYDHGHFGFLVGDSYILRHGERTPLMALSLNVNRHPRYSVNVDGVRAELFACDDDPRRRKVYACLTIDQKTTAYELSNAYDALEHYLSEQSAQVLVRERSCVVFPGGITKPLMDVSLITTWKALEVTKTPVPDKAPSDGGFRSVLLPEKTS
jgi:hypothetical protein